MFHNLYKPPRLFSLMKQKSSKTAKQQAGDKGFTTLKRRTIRYGENQFVMVSLQQIGKRKFVSISRGYRNKGNADIIKSTVTINNRETAMHVSQQIQELSKSLPQIQKVKKVASKHNDIEDKEIRL